MTAKRRWTKEEFKEQLRLAELYGCPRARPVWPLTPTEIAYRKIDPSYAADVVEPEHPQAEVLPFNPWPAARKWTAEPPAASNAMPYAPTDLDRLVETKRAVAAAARADRLRRDPFGLGIWGEHETIEDLVRRQNGE
jgi:hypothetical protein